MNKIKELINEIARDYDDAADWKDARRDLVRLAHEANHEMEIFWSTLQDMLSVLGLEFKRK